MSLVTWDWWLELTMRRENQFLKAALWTPLCTQWHAHVSMHMCTCTYNNVFKELILISNVSARIPYQTEPESKIKHQSSWCTNPRQQGWRKGKRVSGERKALNQWDTMHGLMGYYFSKVHVSSQVCMWFFFWIDWNGKHTHFSLICERGK